MKAMKGTGRRLQWGDENDTCWVESSLEETENLAEENSKGWSEFRYKQS